MAEELPRALCLSGGGYRAMLFHVGSLWRLNEVGLLSTLDLVSSVSGGSITAGVLAKHWTDLAFDARGVAQRLDLVAAELDALASTTIDAGSVIRGGLGPGSVGNRVAAAYARRLFGARTLQDLPDAPRFVFCATSLQTGSLWRFSKRYMADYRVGIVPKPTVSLATAVAASSAFPPVLSPVTLKLDPGGFQAEGRGPLYKKPYIKKAVLTDGGVYDNLGLEPAKRSTTILVSDGGGQLAPVRRPKHAWPLQTLRVLKVIDNQVRSLRKRHVVQQFQNPGPPDGAYWGIRTKIAEYGLPDALPCPEARTARLAAIPTRLAEMPQEQRRRLVNWGYAVCDAALRRYVDPSLDDPPPAFPHPKEGV